VLCITMTSSRNNRTAKRSQRRRNRPDVHNTLRRSVDLPPLSARPRVTHTYRFAADNALSAVDITEKDLLAAMGSICTVGNTTLRSVFYSIKLHSVEMWSTAGTVGGISSMTLEWGSDASVANTNLLITDASISSAYPCHIFAKPPQGSFASFWMDATNDNIVFTVSTDSACVMDVNISGILLDGSVSSATVTVGTASLGVMYYPPLDGSTDKLLPVGLNTAT
jgi:hypothetical protein